MPLNQQPKLQWSVPFPNGPVTISVMTKTTTPSVDLMEAIVVITPARVGITIAASVSALKCQKPLKDPGGPLKDPWKPLKNPQEPVEMTVLPHTGLEITFVMTKTTPLTVDLMVEIVVTMKDQDGTTIVLIVNVLHKFYVKKYLISRNKSCFITVKK